MEKKSKRWIWGIMMMVIIMVVSCFNAQAAKKVREKDRRVVAYVTSWSGVLPDPFAMTNINYAFGHVNDTFDGVRIDNPERLSRIAKLKKDNPKLEVQLSIGG